MRWGQFHSLVAALLCACASTVSATDAGVPTDVASTDGPSGHGLVLHVETGQFTMPAPAVGFQVAGEGANGQWVYATTDANGMAQLHADPSSGLWNITIYQTGYTIETYLDVAGPMPDPVWMAPSSRQGGSPPTVGVTETLTGMVTNLADPMDLVWLSSTDVGAPGGAGPGGYIGSTFSYAAGLPPLQLLAVEQTFAGVLVGSVLSSPMARVDHALTVDLAMPVPPAPPVTRMVNIELPATGVVTAASVSPNWNYEVQRGASVLDARVGYDLPALYSGSPIAIQYPRADLPPDIATISDIVQGPQRPWFGFRTEADLDGETIHAPPIQAFQVSGTTGDSLSVDVDADGYTQCAVDLGVSLAGADLSVWEIQSWSGTSLHLRGLPLLPRMLSEPIFSAGTVVDVTVYVAHTRPRRTPAWPPGSDSTINDITAVQYWSFVAP